jgi:hypothetical protein
MSVSAAGGSVHVYFEYEGGLFSFAIGAVTDATPLCSVEEIAHRFSRARVLGEGLQRLSLDEQVAFVQTGWPQLLAMFSEEQLAEAHRWHGAAVAAFGRKGPVAR